MTPNSSLASGKAGKSKSEKADRPKPDQSKIEPRPPVLQSGKSGGWLPALLAGVAGGLAYDPFRLGFLIALAPVGFFISIQHASRPRGAFLRLLLGGFVFYEIAISWLMSLGHFNEFAPVGIPFLALYMAVYPALAGWITRRWFARLTLMPQFAVFASFWLLGEWIRTLGRLAMPFTLIGSAWVQYPRAIQWADTFGELGLSAQVLLAAAAILGFFQWSASRFGNKRIPWKDAFDGGEPFSSRTANTSQGLIPAIVLAVVSIMLLGTSAWKFSRWEKLLDAAQPTSKLRVAAVQPNIDQDTKLATNMLKDDDARNRLLDKCFQIHEDLVREAVPPGTDLVVMPESSFSDFEFAFDRLTHERIVRMMEPSGADLLFGADRIDVHADRKTYDAYNSAWYLPRGKTMLEAGHQDKMHLVPFGEYLPYFDMIPGFQETIVQIGSFTPGKDVTLFDCKGHRFGALICFESTFGSLGRLAVQSGAEFLTIITNDAWYLRSAGAAQHHRYSVLRAVETRRPVVRCANTGISSIIRASGRIEATLALGKQGVAAGEIVPQKGRTYFVRWGNTGIVFVAVGWIFAAMMIQTKSTVPRP